MVCKLRCDRSLSISVRGTRQIIECDLIQSGFDVTCCPKPRKKNVANRDCFVSLRYVQREERATLDPKQYSPKVPKKRTKKPKAKLENV